MMKSMTRRVKIAVSLPTELVDGARAAVRAGRATSVSAYVAEALEQYANTGDLASLVDEMLAATGGPMTDEERAWADQVLDN